MWTTFWDMHSGGGSKEKWNLIFIEAPKDEAISVFYSRFGHNPERVSCTCCGDDYAIDQYETLDEATEWHYNKANKTLAEFIIDRDVLIIRAEAISDDERSIDVPVQGYVWQ